jgi:hypothetical protein
MALTTGASRRATPVTASGSIRYSPKPNLNLCPKPNPYSYTYPTLSYPLYRCDSSSTFYTREPGKLFFKGTAVAVLDASLSEVLGWTWLISSPGVRVQGPPALPI